MRYQVFTNRNRSSALFLRRRLQHQTVLFLALIAMLLGGSWVRPAQAASTSTRVLPSLQDQAAANPSKMFRVVVQRIGITTTADGKVKTYGGSKVKDLKANAFVATMPGGK